MDRKDDALKILTKMKNDEYHYLGEGFSGVVYHDNKYVYKVHLPLAGNSYGESDGLSYLQEKADALRDSDFFYNIEIIDKYGPKILKYNYEESEQVTKISEGEYVDFLTECLKRKIIFKNIKKETNFIRVQGRLKFIDYEILPYNDNLFLNLAARAYIDLKYPDLSLDQYNRLKRSVINNFNIPEMKGFGEFLNKIFENYTFGNDNYLKSYEMKQNSLIQTKTNLKHETSGKRNVSLLIKACPQDSGLLYEQVIHINKQLSGPDTFLEKLLVIDKKEEDFLREYTKEGNLKDLRAVGNRLISDGIIDGCIELPDDEIVPTNLKWFGLSSSDTHSLSKIPITPQLYAFESAKGDYILQLDCDVLICRYDPKHSYLDDMIGALEANENSISVGFNIPKKNNIQFTDYHAPEGGYKPEVRFSLIHKERMLKSRPWPNELIKGKLKYSWYQSLHLHQKETHLVSLRGGDPRSFFIHPQNYRKTCNYNMSIITDRVEKGIIPDFQLEQFDLQGSLYGWTVPKRNEKLVVFCLIDKNTPIERFYRFFESIKKQSFKDYGVLIINNTADHLLDKKLWDTLKSYKNVTYLFNRYTLMTSQCLYIGLHYFTNNLDSLIILSNPNDYFIGNETFAEMVERVNLYEADVMIGKQIDVNSLHDCGLLTVDFLRPEEVESNTYQSPKAFKKELFETLSPYDLKKMKKNKIIAANFKKLNQQYDWMEDPEYANFFTQILMKSKNPIRFDIVNYIIDSRTIQINEIKETLEQLNSDNKALPSRSVIDGRVDFSTNMKKIELDITYSCNLNCVSCNRSCPQAPSDNSDMTLEQVHRFIEESIQKGVKWDLINILGGEPTLHPNFLEIINMILNEYIKKYSPDTILQITSNGYSEKTRNILHQLPDSENVVIDDYSFKDSPIVPYFTPFNLAPIDTDEFKDLDFHRGCWVTSYCGMGLNSYGYYPCAVAGGIDRVKGDDAGIKSLADVTPEKMKELLNQFCRFCGNMVDYNVNNGDFIPRCEKDVFSKNKVTKSWESMYSKYHNNRPKLKRVYE